jgi:hypothetical protein
VEREHLLDEVRSMREEIKALTEVVRADSRGAD